MENWAILLVGSISAIIITFVLMVVYFVVFQYRWFFSKQNVKFVRGWPLVGSLNEFITGKKAFSEFLVGLYRRYPDEPVIGFYNLTHPVYLIRDLDLIKKVVIQDFDHFVNHQSNFDISGDYLMDRTLFFSRDQRWRDMRTILSPAFTGNKMRLMFDLIQETTTELIETLQTVYATAGAKDGEPSVGFEVELKDVLSRYTTNMIATCAFGLKVDSIKQRDNEFYLAAKYLTNFDGKQGFKFLLNNVMPLVIKFLGISFVPENLCNYFRNVVNTTIKYREENNVHRPDMVHLLIEAKKGTLTDDDSDELRPKKTSNFHRVLTVEKGNF